MCKFKMLCFYSNLLCFLCGCAVGLELQQMGVVMGTAVDLVKAENEDKIRITVEITNFSRESGEQDAK